MEALVRRGFALTVFYFACSVLLGYYVFFAPSGMSLSAMFVILTVFVLTHVYERRRDRRFKEVNAELTKLLEQAREEMRLDKS